MRARANGTTADSIFPAHSRVEVNHLPLLPAATAPALGSLFSLLLSRGSYTPGSSFDFSLVRSLSLFSEARASSLYFSPRPFAFGAPARVDVKKLGVGNGLEKSRALRKKKNVIKSSLRRFKASERSEIF